jgi:uncharacterized protein Yka (UPF0111/DUF47 family)
VIHKTEIVSELGIQELLFPKAVNDALAANDRIKYFFSLIQIAKQHADDPNEMFSNLADDRYASGVEDKRFDTVISESTKIDSNHYYIASFRLILDQIFICFNIMTAPLITKTQKYDIGKDRRIVSVLKDSKFQSSYFNRYETLKKQIRIDENDIVSADSIYIITSGKRENGDSLHLLVMDIHKALNKLQTDISEELIGGASVYGVTEEDKNLVKSFMKGLDETATLKFEHEGLGTTATRSGENLIIQNDIGTTDAHVLVVRVNSITTTLTYTDIHIQRLLFFQSLFERYKIKWNDTISKKISHSTRGGIADEVYHMGIGVYNAKDLTDLNEYLFFLGSRIVFLIDWNRARKRLTRFVKKQDSVKILKWSADNNYGHRAFLRMGGEQLIYNAIEQSTNSAIRYGQQLDEIIGRERTVEFIKFVLEVCSQYLINGKSEYLVRDIVRAKLAGYFHTAEQDFIHVIADHASLLVEIATGVRDALIESIHEGGYEYLRRNLSRARQWETKADDLVNRFRTMAKRSTTASKLFQQILLRADDSADSLEESAFFLTLLQDHDEIQLQILYDLFGGILDTSLHTCREYLKAVENAKHIYRGSSQEEIEDFLQSIDRIIALEHRMDEENRVLIELLVNKIKEFKQFYIFSEIIKNIEEATDSLMKAALTLREYALGNLMVA